MRLVNALAVALNQRDEPTGAHCERTTRLSVSLGERCGLTQRELEQLCKVARWHDVGKIGIPDRILFKPGRLSDEEWLIMRSHAELGERILVAIGDEEMNEVARAVRHHHENFDGQGYPDGLAGEAIPVASRIVALADAYDAMSMPRPYHRERTHLEIMRILDEEVGRKLDPYLLGHFAALVERPEMRGGAA